MRKILTIALFLIVSVCSLAQTIEPKHTFNLELGLPNGFANKPFKNIMQGLINAEPYYQFAFKNHIIVGAGLRYSYFAINEFKVPEQVYGGMHSAGVFIKGGWERFHTDRFATDISLKAGYTQNYFVTDLNDSIGVNPLQVNSIYLEPSVSLILTADEFTSYRLVIAYGFQGFGYKPNMIGLETFGGYDPSEFNRTTSFLIVGFGFTYYFKPKN